MHWSMCYHQRSMLAYILKTYLDEPLDVLLGEEAEAEGELLEAYAIN